MKKLLLNLILLCGLCAPTVWAATPVAPSNTNEAASVTINKDNLKSLIETLESDTARGEFINNLKTLESLETEKEPEEGPVLSKVLGIENQTQTFLSGYSAFLERNNLNNSVVGKFALTLGAVLCALVLSLLASHGGNLLQRIAKDLRVRFVLSHGRLLFYARAIRFLLQTGIYVLLAYALITIWSLPILDFLVSAAALKFITSAFSVILVIAIGISIWEAVSGAIDYGLKKANDRNATRLRTLLPMLRNILFMVFALLFGLMLLSEIGLNIMPLLAGAGIVGVAVGFGAQSMVKDFLTGFTIILEDLIHVGDVIRLDQFTGVVETITLRKVQLRSIDGTVITMPHSAITVIENLTKDFSFYVLDMSVAYDSDIDKVVDTMQIVDSRIRNDDAFASLIMEPIEIMGVERMMDSAIVVRARVKTLPSQQWKVGREYNRRLRDAFAEAGIEIPYPHQVVINKQA